MGALAKYWEDNNRLAEDRLRDMEEESGMSTLKTIKPTQKQKIEIERQKRSNPFAPKKGRMEVLSHREEILMYFQEYLHKEWRDFLFHNGWRWSGARQCWVKRYTSKNYEFSYKFITGREYREEEVTDLCLDDF